jgi:hypothetical protein
VRAQRIRAACCDPMEEQALVLVPLGASAPGPDGAAGYPLPRVSDAEAQALMVPSPCSCICPSAPRHAAAAVGRRGWLPARGLSGAGARAQRAQMQRRSELRELRQHAAAHRVGPAAGLEMSPAEFAAARGGAPPGAAAAEEEAAAAGSPGGREAGGGSGAGDAGLLYSDLELTCRERRLTQAGPPPAHRICVTWRARLWSDAW